MRAARKPRRRRLPTRTRAAISRRPARIALRHWDELTGRGRIETLRLWLDRCTDEEIESDAQLSIAAAWVAVLLGDPVGARRFVAAAERRPLDVPSADGATSLRSALAIVRTSRGTRRNPRDAA